jgi:hypothetical protein
VSNAKNKYQLKAGKDFLVVCSDMPLNFNDATVILNNLEDYKWEVVDLKAASNPIDERKPAMSKKRGKK